MSNLPEKIRVVTFGRRGPIGADGPAGPAGADGAPGADGADGAPGSQFYYGTGAPSGALGVVGDMYVDNAAWHMYQKTGLSTWTDLGAISGGGGSEHKQQSFSVTRYTLSAGVTTQIASANANRRFLSIHSARVTTGNPTYLGFDNGVLVGHGIVIWSSANQGFSSREYSKIVPDGAVWAVASTPEEIVVMESTDADAGFVQTTTFTRTRIYASAGVSTLLLPQNLNRKYLELCIPASSQPSFFKFGSAAGLSDGVSIWGTVGLNSRIWERIVPTDAVYVYPYLNNVNVVAIEG